MPNRWMRAFRLRASMAEVRRPRGPVQRVYANLVRLLQGKAAAALISLFTLAIATRALRPAGYGVLVLVSGFATAVGGVMEFPCWRAILHYGTEAIASGDEERLLRLLRLTALTELGGGVAAVVAAATLGSWLGPRLGWSAEATRFAIPFGFATLASIRSVPAAYLQLRGHYGLLSLHSLIQPTVRLIGALLLLRPGYASLHAFLVVWLIAAVIEWASLWLLGVLIAHRHLGLRRLRGSTRGVTRDNAGLWRFMIGANADITIGSLSGRLVPLIIGWSSGPAMAALYTVAQKATVVIEQPAQILARTAFAEFAELLVGRRYEVLRRVMIRCISVGMLASLLPLAIAITLQRPIAELLGGPRFTAAAPLMPLLLLAQILLLATSLISSGLSALGRPGLSFAAYGIVTLGLLPLLPVSLRWMGPIGIGLQAIATALCLVSFFGALFERELRRQASHARHEALVA